jgi:hypothetical protein
MHLLPRWIEISTLPLERGPRRGESRAQDDDTARPQVYIPPPGSL